MPNNSASKSSGMIAPLLLLLMALVVVGTVGGYYYGSKGKARPYTPVSVAEKMIAEPEKQWGTLVQNVYGEFLVKGQVTAIEQGTSTIGNSQGAGWFFTLKNGASEQKYFVQNDASFKAGKENDYNKWRAIKPAEIKVGDTVGIQTHAQFKEGVTPNDFFGYWVFKFE
jgi:hypothetical protein